MSIQNLVELSRRYGGDPKWVLAGGGNTSVKEDDLLYIKASGYALATMTREGLVAMRRPALQQIWNEDYPSKVEAREEKALADLMAARHPDDTDKRPSVETLMHEAMPFTYVIHTHPALVNGITCGHDGESAAGELFGDELLWIPLVNPGYVLAKRVKTELEEYRRRHGRAPRIALLQNHGLVVAGDEPEKIVSLHDEILERVNNRLRRTPDLSEVDIDEELVSRLEADIAQAYVEARTAAGVDTAPAGAGTAFRTNAEMARLVSDRSAFERVAGPFTPDHIVYAGPRPPLVARRDGREAQRRAIREVFDSHYREFAILPRALGVEGVGAFGVGPSDGAAEKAALLFEDAVKVGAYSESFGGPRFMESDQVDFIMSWEVEAYRAKISGGA